MNLRSILSAAAIALAMASLGLGQVSPPTATTRDASSVRDRLQWESLPDLPAELGLAGPFVGVHADRLIVAGGADFPRPVWESDKRWHDAVYVLENTPSGYAWSGGGRLPQPIAYGAAVSTPQGVVCMGGNNADEVFDEVFLLRWDTTAGKVESIAYPPLPRPCAYGAAALVGDVIYLAGGQTGGGIDTAMDNFWALDLSRRGDAAEFRWREISPLPGGPRAFNAAASQHNGFEDCFYVMSGRRQSGEGIEFLRDLWEFSPRSSEWRRRSDLPRSVAAGGAVGFGQSHIFVLGGDDGALFDRTDELKDDHPGFPKEALAYHTLTDTWSSLGAAPQNQLSSVPVLWDGRVVLASGEIRPRVRTASVWSVVPVAATRGFGAVNYAVLVAYFAAVLGVGFYFARRNKTTDDYFRGGKGIPWWAAGCSIFATMLSSLTFTGLPAKAYAQDWVYAVGNLMIPVVAFAAVFVALPFYRRIDATSAYEYLELRFSRGLRLFGSASFTLYHLFRMAVVMSLTGLVLAVATPLTPAQSVLLMGVLSIVYCTVGGIEAVIWTDTLQTFVLLGGALLALAMLLAGAEGSVGEIAQAAAEADKLRVANWSLGGTGAYLAFWVIVLGAGGQHLAAYTADQAIVQRYMTSPSESLAARSIWLNAVLAVPATLLFFAIGTALWAYYGSHPERLDPGIATDQIFPLFIAREMPLGIAGLVVAGVFSAAQSTVSTSMNSTATTVVTDFLRPYGVCGSDQGYLWAARVITLVSGVAGTLLGLVFIDPRITSLFDASIIVVGLFMGVLGGLFMLGVLTRRANAFGAAIGAAAGVGVTAWLYFNTEVNGYLYIAVGIATCVAVGYVASFLRRSDRDLRGLTIHTLGTSAAAADVPTG